MRSQHTPNPPQRSKTGAARLLSVVAGDTVISADGRRVRLVGIEAPKLRLGRPDFTKWPLADEARNAREALVLGKDISLPYSVRRIDRHDRVLDPVVTADCVWVQGALLATGFAPDDYLGHRIRVRS